MRTGTKKQQEFLALMMSPDGPAEMDELAEMIDVPLEDVQQWYRSAEFRRWVSNRLEDVGTQLVPLVWKEVLLIGRSTAAPAKVRLEAFQMFIERFDQGRPIDLRKEKAKARVRAALTR